MWTLLCSINIFIKVVVAYNMNQYVLVHIFRTLLAIALGIYVIQSKVVGFGLWLPNIYVYVSLLIILWISIKGLTKKSSFLAIPLVFIILCIWHRQIGYCHLPSINSLSSWDSCTHGQSVSSYPDLQQSLLVIIDAMTFNFL